jgi:hypothetical protein
VSREIFANWRAVADIGLAGHRSTTHVELASYALAGHLLPLHTDMAVLLRRKLYPTPENWRVVGQVEVGEGSVGNAGGFTHENDQGYQYTVTRMHPNGYRARVREPIRVDIDGGGSRIAPALPAWPRDIGVTPIDGGKFRVTWAYEPWGQGGYPTDFQVFEGSDAASIDYGTVLGTVSYVAEQRFYEFETDAFTDGTAHAFAVRARSSAGTAEQNTFTTGVVRASDAAPDAPAITGVGIRR